MSDERERRYRTIVADPPWEMDDPRGAGKTLTTSRRHPLPYPTMTVAQIAALPILSLAENDAHLYLWTTQNRLRDSFDVVETWGFRVSATLTWCKAPRGIMGGAYRSSTEFVHFAKRGSLAHKTQAPSRWFEWPRSEHSAKPEAFLDLVEQVSPGPYCELFARRASFGWDYWGDQSLGTAEMAS